MEYLVILVTAVAAFIGFYAFFSPDGEPMTKTRLVVGLGCLTLVLVVWLSLPEENGTAGSDCQALGRAVWDC